MIENGQEHPEIAVGEVPVVGMMQAVKIRCNHKVAQPGIYPPRDVDIAVRENDYETPGDLIQHKYRHRRSQQRNHRGRRECYQEYFQRVIACGSSKVEIGIAVMYRMYSPQPGDTVHQAVYEISSKIQGEKSDDQGRDKGTVGAGEETNLPVRRQPAKGYENHHIYPVTQDLIGDTQADICRPAPGAVGEGLPAGRGDFPQRSEDKGSYQHAQDNVVFVTG